MKRWAWGLNDWPEDRYWFRITEALPGETDEALIARARAEYHPELAVVIIEEVPSSQHEVTLIEEMQ